MCGLETSIHDELVCFTDGIVKNYRDDLLKHDKEALETYPGVRFLHWARESGTTIVFLHDADSDVYPAKGAFVKYLFGVANRQHILNEQLLMAKYHGRPHNNPDQYSVHYYDGKRLRCVSVEKAIEIASAHVTHVNRQWGW